MSNYTFEQFEELGDSLAQLARGGQPRTGPDAALDRYAAREAKYLAERLAELDGDLLADLGDLLDLWAAPGSELRSVQARIDTAAAAEYKSPARQFRYTETPLAELHAALERLTGEITDTLAIVRRLSAAK